MRFTVFCFLFILIYCTAVYAQRDTFLTVKAGNTARPDTAAPVPANHNEQFPADSAAIAFLTPNPLRENKFMTALLKNNLPGLYSSPSVSITPKSFFKGGHLRQLRSTWVIVVIIGLLIYTALLNIFLGNDIKSIIQTFYSKQGTWQTDKEANLVNWWAFIGLFTLFGLAFGLVLYQLSVYYNHNYSISGFGLFISFSFLISVLFAVKFLALKFIGFVFDISKPVSQYITILNITYFNTAFVFLSVAVCFSLLAKPLIPTLLNFTLVVIAIIFVWQYLRNSINIVSDFRFHKFYLFIYLCALEICPVLILIKALDI